MREQVDQKWQYAIGDEKIREKVVPEEELGFFFVLGLGWLWLCVRKHGCGIEVLVWCRAAGPAAVGGGAFLRGFILTTAALHSNMSRLLQSGGEVLYIVCIPYQLTVETMLQ